VINITQPNTFVMIIPLTVMNQQINTLKWTDFLKPSERRGGVGFKLCMFAWMQWKTSQLLKNQYI